MDSLDYSAISYSPMKAHPATELFPLMGKTELAELATDIVKHGLHVPIVTYHDMILDGRNRWLACRMTGIEPRTCEWSEQGSATEWVISLNVHRRHLTQSQKAAIAVDALPLLEEEARKRQVAYLRRGIDTPVPAQIPERGGESREQAARVFNVSPRYVTDAKALQQSAPELFQAVRQGDKTITEAKREIKEQKRDEIREQNRQLVASTPSITVSNDGQRYQCIVLDPPWDWGDEGDDDQYGRARPTYITMPFDEVMALPISRLAAGNSHIYLWITNRSLPKGFMLLDAWGFRYITALTWVKPSFGMGNYFRGSTEHVLFGVRGSLPLLRRDVGTHFSAPRPEMHSTKPDSFYQLVESCSPGPWLEMFSRKVRPGWIVWGAEVGSGAVL